MTRITKSSSAPADRSVMDTDSSSKPSLEDRSSTAVETIPNSGPPNRPSMTVDRFRELFSKLHAQVKHFDKKDPQIQTLVTRVKASHQRPLDEPILRDLLYDDSITLEECADWNEILKNGISIAVKRARMFVLIELPEGINRPSSEIGLPEVEAACLRHWKVNAWVQADGTIGDQPPHHQSRTYPERYAEPFIKFISSNPTVFHAVDSVRQSVEEAGFKRLSERDVWSGRLEKAGKYFVERNGSSIIAFTIGKDYKPGNGASIIATHIDALATRLKPISKVPTKEGFVQLGVAPYAGALNATWWDRDLGIGGRVLVRDSSTGKITKRLVKLDWPIARIPTLAPHFGAAAHFDGANKETEMVPIIGLDNADISPMPRGHESSSQCFSRKVNAFAETQPPRLVSAISSALSIKDLSTILNWELELFDTQPAQLGGVEKDLIFAPRVDDKLCSWAAIEALLTASCHASPNTLNIVACFDDEEIGSLLRQGAHSNFLPSVISRVAGAFSSSSSSSSSDSSHSQSTSSPADADIIGRTYANSFLISADVSHAVNPNFLYSYLAEHAPRLNVGVAIQADPNGHTTTDSVSTSFLQRIADKSGQKLQVFQIRNDSRSGGTVGPMLSSKMGMRAIDAGIPQLSMHSIRATIGNQDPGLGVALFKGFFEGFEEVDEEFRT